MTPRQGNDGVATARERVIGCLLVVLGTLTLATGIYFLVFRPAMLPEDIRFTGVMSDRQPPRMIEWLEIVFRTWGGFMVGFGILLIGIAVYFITRRRAFLDWGTAIAIGIGFGRFLVSNMRLDSNYVIFIGGLFGLAIVVALLLILPGGRRVDPIARGKDAS